MKQELQNGWRKGKATAAPFGMVWIDSCRSRRCRLHLSWKPWAPASQCICAATLQTPLPCGASWSVQIRTFLPRVWFRKACSPVGLRCPFSMSQKISPMGSFLMCYLGSPKTTGFYWTFTRHTKEINKKNTIRILWRQLCSAVFSELHPIWISTVWGARWLHLNNTEITQYFSVFLG